MEVTPLAIINNNALQGGSNLKRLSEEEKLGPINEIRKVRKKIELVPEWKLKGKYNQNTIYESGN